MITPAKWQAKGGDKNEAFRREIVPYMSKIVYYPYTNDVFNITSQGGITYFLSEQDLPKHRILSIRKNDPQVFMQEEDIDLSLNKERKTYYDELTESIVEKTSDGARLLIVNRKIADGKINVKITNVLSGDVNRLNCCGGMVLTPAYIDNNTNNKNIHTSCIGAFSTEEEAEYFISYLATKLVRFLVGIASHTVAFTNKETWRFVPAPDAFDHIFTDEELYKKYNLTQEEINIIESVIKERKQK